MYGQRSGVHVKTRTAPSSTKDARIEFRVNLAQKSLLERAAAAQGQKLSDFVIGASTEAAEMALADQNRFLLSEAQMTEFLARLEDPPSELPALRALFDRKSVFA